MFNSLVPTDSGLPNKIVQSNTKIKIMTQNLANGLVSDPLSMQQILEVSHVAFFNLDKLHWKFN